MSAITATRRRPLSVRVPLCLSRAAWYVLCGLLAVTMLLPLVWMLSISLKTDGNIQQLPPTFFPTQFEWSNYVKGPEQINFFRLLLNTLIVTVLSTIGSVISSTIGMVAMRSSRNVGSVSVTASLSAW